jgi:hypothetical protein
VKEHRWTFWARDERGKRHRGVVSYGDEVPVEGSAPPAEFRIALLAAPSTVENVPPATAICIPRLSKTRALVDAATVPLSLSHELAALKRGVLPAPHHAQYEAGQVLLAIGTIDATKIFPSGKPNVEFERLALTLVDVARGEMIAPYTAAIRYELKLPPGSNALLALESRLAPADPRERPPARAPGISRLKKTLSRLKDGAAPAVSLDVLTEDLRFLRLFESEEHALRREAMDRLLADIIQDPSPPPPKTTPAPAPIVPLRRRREEP